MTLEAASVGALHSHPTCLMFVYRTGGCIYLLVSSSMSMVRGVGAGADAVRDDVV